MLSNSIKLTIICLFIFLFTPNFAFSGMVDRYLQNADKHFDRGVGKFVDMTNKHVIGMPVDKNTRNIQINSAKLLLDPRASKSDQYWREIESSAEKLFGVNSGSSNYSSSGSGSSAYSSQCMNHLKEIRHIAKKAAIANRQKDIKTFMKCEWEYNDFCVNLLKCYIDNKEYNHALDWAYNIKSNGVERDFAMVWLKRWNSEKFRLKMVLEGQDDW